jgi:hypothetical protein
LKFELSYNPKENIKIFKYIKKNKHEFFEIIIHELRNHLINFIKNNDKKNFKYIINGELNFSLQYSAVINCWWHQDVILDFYKNKLNLLQKLNHYQKKPFYFDALLGIMDNDGDLCKKILVPKRNRYFVKNFIEENDLSEKILLQYIKNNEIPLEKNHDNGFLFEQEVEIIEKTYGTCNEVKYFGQNILLSFVLPLSIYNQTAYSIISETKYDKDYTFFTEKTLKPILAKRLFVAFCGPYFLKNLKKRGFKTFDGIIDESYDLVEDDQTRWKMAAEQVKWLMSQDQLYILNKIEDIVQHNFNIMTKNYSEFSKLAF